GLEPDTILFNASVKFENSDTSSYKINLTLNITNTSNTVVYNSTQPFTISGGSTITANFTGINVSGWNEGVYQLNAYVRGEKSDNRSEYFILKSVSAAAKTVSYMCNGTIEYFNVTVVHPFNDSIEYNVSLSLPSGWSYSGSQMQSVASPGNYTFKFNLTSGQTADNHTIDATIRYIYPLGISQQTISNNTQLSLNSSAGITAARHDLIRKDYAIGTYANLTVFYFNISSARTNINVSVNGNFLGIMPAANLSTSYTFTNVSVAWLNTTIINVTYQGNLTNITESSLTYGSEKRKNTTSQIEMSDAMPILEVVRETPKIVGSNKVFDSILSVHNKGCAATSGATTVKEVLSTGWTPANPSLRGDVTLTSASSDLINNILTWQLGSIGINKYAVLTYQIKSPTAYPSNGELQYNATWGSWSLAEPSLFNVQTFNYSSESHLEFDLTAVQQSNIYPWLEPRSSQLGKYYNFSLKVTNIGDAAASDWNITLSIPSACDYISSTHNGTWDSGASKAEWTLPSTAVYGSTYLNFTLNCTEVGKKVLVAEGIRNTSQTTTYVNDTNIGCSGSSCSSSQPYTFSKPANVRYEQLKNIDFNIRYNWNASGLTIGEGLVNFTDDNNAEQQVWQEFAFADSSGNIWSNYSIDSSDKAKYVSASRTIGVKSYTDGIVGKTGNVTVDKISYTWEHGRLFSEPQNLFIKVKVYDYVPLNTNFTLLISNNASVRTGGWGESYNFTALTMDRFGRNVTVIAWHRKGAAAYSQIGNWTCANCGSWAQANFSYVYNANDIGSWRTKINFTNADGGSEASEIDYTIEADDINADYAYPGNNATVNRSQSTNFTINIYDRDNSTAPGYLVSGGMDEGKGKIWISKLNQIDLFDSPSGISSNASGSLLRSMSNTSTEWCKTSDYYLGPNYWYGGVSGATTYKQNLTSVRPFQLMGDLYNTYVSPQDANYTLGSTIALRGTILNDCNTEITDATVVFNLSSGSYSTTQLVAYQSDAYKNTTYTLPSNAPIGWYNVTMSSSKTYYWNGTYTKTNAFYYGTAIRMEYQNMTPSGGGGWGESPFTFFVNITNNQTTRVDLWLWNASGWFYEYNETCSGGACANTTKITANRNFTCSDIGSWVARFNATDVIGVSNNSLPNLTFTVQRDDIIVEHYAGNDSKVNRSDSQPGYTSLLAVRINDTDNRSYTVGVDNTSALFTYVYNGTSWKTENELKNEQGVNYSLAFNPGCDYAPGARNWNMTVSGASCHKNISSLNFVVNIIGDLSNSISVPDGATNYTQGDNILLRAQVTDDCSKAITGLTTRYFNLTNGSANYALPCTANDENSGWYNCTWASGSNATGYWNATFYSGIANYNPGTDTERFFLSSTPVLSAANVTPGSGGWGRANYTYKVNVTDIDGDTVTVKFWLSKDDGVWQYITNQTCSNCQNSQLQFNYSYSSSDLGNWSFKFNSTDLHDNSAELIGGSHIVAKDTIAINHFSGNNSNVNRSDLLSGNEVQLAAFVYDSDAVANTTAIGASTFHVYITNQTTTWVELVESINNTNATLGIYYYVDFNPTCNYSAAQQLWNMSVYGDPAYQNATSLNFVVNVYGTSNATYVSPTGLVPYERGSTFTIVGNLYDDCDNAVSGAAVDYTLVSGSSSYSCNATENSGWQAGGASYNCTWSSAGKAVGKYNVTMTATKSYYLSSTDTEENAFKINATPILRAADIDIRSDGWSFARNFTVNVSDNSGDSVNVSLYELVSGAWVKIGSTKNCTSCSNYTISWNSSYSCSDVATGSRQFKMNATDTEGNTYTTTGTDYVGGTNAFTIEKNNVIIEYVYGNETNATIQAYTNLTLRVYDTDKGTYSLSPAAPISFNITKAGQGAQYYEMTTVTTNATGSAIYTFYADTSFSPAKQNWFGFLDTGETPACYQYNASGVYNVNVISNRPILSNEVVGPISGGWGDIRRFNVSVLDTNNSATVYLYKGSTTSGPWTQLDQQSYTTPGVTENLTFTYAFGCGDIGGGLWYFKFNASNQEGNVYSTSEVATNNFSLAKDYISYTNVYGNDSTANRNGSQTDLFSLRWWDANGSVVTGLNTRFKATYDGSTWDAGATNASDGSGYAYYSFNPGCTPRYYAGMQKWQAIVSSDACYQDNSTAQYNFTIMGDILLTLSKPDGTLNFTQEGTIPFLGYTVDDCGSALSANVSFYMNSSGSAEYNCNSTSPVVPIGANAYSCDFASSLSTVRGYYNASMNASTAYHYDNSIWRVGSPGLFYLFPLKKLESASVEPASAGWGRTNWNFSVISSSGDPDNAYDVKLYIGSSWPPTSECVGCANKTSVINANNIGLQSYWLKNWTYQQQGTWYYRYSIGDTYTTTVSSISVTKDQTNISYRAGNDTDVTKDTAPQMLGVQVFDLDANAPNLNPAATVNFVLLHSSYGGGEKQIGSNTTNASGYAEFLFNVTDCNYQAGSQYWRAEINSSESNYNISYTPENYTISITLTGCQATVDVYPPVLTPAEAFQNRTFAVNSTVTAWISAAKNVTVEINASDSWEVSNKSQWYSSIGISSYTPVTWRINATSYGNYILNVTANSSNAGSDSLLSSSFTVRKVRPESSALGTFPVSIGAGNETVFGWQCDAGNYRIALFNATWNSSSGTEARVHAYGGSSWIELLHSQYVNNSLPVSKVMPALSSQMFPNGTGYCNLKIKNIGSSRLDINSLSLLAYYEPTVKVRDIIAKLGDTETTGLEPDTILFNASVKFENSDSVSYKINLTLNITNQSDTVVYNSTQAFTIGASSTITANFTGINTTGWSQGVYTLHSFITGEKNDNRSEHLTFRYVSASAKTADYMCNGTTEYMNVTVVHPFNDSIQYNVSLSLPSGWSYSGSQLVTGSLPGNYTVKFNLTSGQTSNNFTIDAFVNYTYPALSNSKNTTAQIEMSDAMPILEVTRETPMVVGNGKEFYSRLAVHNKGCASATSVSFVEQAPSGWTAYEQTMDGSSAGQADIPTSQIRFASTDFGTLTAGGYKVIAYKVFPPSQNAQQGSFRYNLTWGTRNVYEPAAHVVTTMNYTSEAHLAFNIVAIGSWKARSALPEETQAFNLSVTNIGDKNASAGEWNISLAIPANCSASNFTGSWNSTEQTIVWQLDNDLVPASETNFRFNLTCNSSGKYVLAATAINDTRQETAFVNDTGIGCTGAGCADRQAFVFSKPAGVRYEKLKEIAFYITHSWSGAGLTIGEGAVNFSDDANIASRVWQSFAFNPESASEWANFSIDAEEQVKFVSASRNISMSSYTDAISGANGNVTVEKIAYTWSHGRLFSDTQPLFVSIQPYVFVPDAPVLQSPPNASTQVSSPIVLSWFPSTGATNYYVFGDTSDGDTYLAQTTVTNYLWSDLESGLYKWKVIAATATQNSTFSDTWQFNLDLCAQDPGYASYLTYPMTYDNTTDTLTVIGNSTFGTVSNPITFQDIYLFARAARGICAVIRPASGNYVIKSRLAIGNGTQPVTVASKGEALSFTSASMPELFVNKSGRIIFGDVVNNIPQEGVSIKFTSNATDDTLLDVAGGEIALYDSYVADVGDAWGKFVYRGACGSGNTFSNQSNTSLTIKKTIFDRAARGQFIYTSNVTMDDVKINRINSSAVLGYGLVTACDMPTLSNLQIYHQEQDGGAIQTTSNMPNNTEITIMDSVFQYNSKDIIATANGRGVRLINTQWGRTYDWNYGGGNGTNATTIKELYGFKPKVTDSSGAALANVSIIARNIYGTQIFALNTNNSGDIVSEQYMTTWQVEKSASGEAITSYNPFTVKVKTYGKTFVTEAKTFAARTVETKQLSANPFSNRTEANALALTGIRYTPPTSVAYGDESNSSWTTSGQLQNYPVVQSEFFALFANGTKIVEGTNYSVHYGTGVIDFVQSMEGKEIKSVYSYGGNITLFNGATSCYSLNDIYDYMQANLSDVVSTVDGLSYTFYVGLIIGNYSTTQGCIYDPSASMVFEDGYTYAFSTAGGFIDLAGITAGAGSGGTGGGGLPLNIYNDVGSTYQPGQTVYIFSTTLDSSGNLVNATVNVAAYYPYPNNSIVSTGTSRIQTTGRHIYNFTLSASALTGTYRVDIGATYGSNQVHDNVAFTVASSGGSGGGTPEVIVDAPALVTVNTSFDITMLAKSNLGLAINCESTPTITIRDTLLGSDVIS
ncbi:MAG: hypothetical protein QME12_04045, partial [Nanoarchaeota archaeon]|nr:hypothetical protein [Nanoarchaeota archaeon]